MDSIMILYRLITLLLIFGVLPSCLMKEKEKENKNQPPSHVQAAFPVKGLQGVLARVTISHGSSGGGEIPLLVKAAPDYMVLAFPSNGLLAGGEVRISKNECAFIDSTTRRSATIPVSRIPSFLGLPRKGTSWQAKLMGVRQEGDEKEWEIRFSGATGTRTLLLREALQSNKSPLLLSLVFLPVGGVPVLAHTIGEPISWTWTTLQEGKRGSTQWKVMSHSPARFNKNDCIPDIPNYHKVTLAQILQGYTKNTVVSQNAVHLTTRKSSGVVYLNGQIMDFISPGNDIHLPLKVGGTITVYQLFGGVPLVDRHMKIPLKWTIH